jgi:hypothetical protein
MRVSWKVEIFMGMVEIFSQINPLIGAKILFYGILRDIPSLYIEVVLK